MRDFTPCPKPHRVVSQKEIDRQRKPYCEYCGRYGRSQTHHVVSRKSGGGDVPENLISLCPTCHMLAHNGEIEKDELWEKIAAREGITKAHAREAAFAAYRTAHRGE